MSTTIATADYRADTLEIKGQKYDLESYRQFLMDNFRILVDRFLIGSHVVNGCRVFTYDWDAIIEYSITMDIPFEYKTQTERR